MTDEQALELARLYFDAGKAGQPMPPIPEGVNPSACIGAYDSGHRAATWRERYTCEQQGMKFVLKAKA